MPDDAVPASTQQIIEALELEEQPGGTPAAQTSLAARAPEAVARCVFTCVHMLSDVFTCLK